jgi:hypothetical protein
LTDHTTNTQISKEINITPVFNKIKAYRRNWLQHVNGNPRNTLPRILKTADQQAKESRGDHYTDF